MRQQWYRAATSKAETLKELQDKWLASRDFKESANMAHRVNDKSEAGTRPVAVVHPAAVAVIKQRLVGAAKDKKAGGRLFRELRQGADSKWSAAATKAFGRYRRSLDVPDGTDFSLVPPRRGGHP